MHMQARAKKKSRRLCELILAPEAAPDPVQLLLAVNGKGKLACEIAEAASTECFQLLQVRLPWH